MGAILKGHKGRKGRSYRRSISKFPVHGFEMNATPSDLPKCDDNGLVGCWMFITQMLTIRKIKKIVKG